MEISASKRIGKISIKSLRDLILDSNLTDRDTVLLHQKDFDELAVEYRETYNESFQIPYLLLDVLIKEDKRLTTSQGRIVVLTNDTESVRTNIIEDNPYETIYQCGWCGNIVGYDGSKLNSEIRKDKIRIHQKHNNTITEKQVNGYCCPNGHETKH